MINIRHVTFPWEPSAQCMFLLVENCALNEMKKKPLFCVVVVMAMVGRDAQNDWRKLIGRFHI